VSFSEIIHKTGSVAAVFGRHGMPPSASNDAGTAFCSRIKKRQITRTDDVSL